MAQGRQEGILRNDQARRMEKQKKSEIEENCRIIGCKGVFRVTNDRRHCAQLCTIGYTQVAGVDFQDNFAPVVNNVAFWIAIVLMMV